MKKFLSIIGGLALAFLMMMIFESANSLIFPFPEGMNTTDMEAVQNFTKTLPATAYILVLIGWALGSFWAGFLAAKILKEQSFLVPGTLSALLIIGGISNFLLIAHPVWMLILGSLFFISGPFLGFKAGLNPANRF